MKNSLFIARVRNIAEKLYFLFAVIFVAEIVVAVILIPVTFFVLSEPHALARASQNVAEVNTASASLIASVSVVARIFSTVCLHGGKIASFSFDGNSDECCLVVYGCRCEDVVNAQFTRVCFRDSEPVFSLAIPLGKNVFYPQKRQNRDSSGMFHMVGAPRCDGKRMLRQFAERLTVFTPHLFAEKTNADEAAFSVSVRPTVLYSVLKVCAELATDLCLREEHVSVCVHDDVCTISLSFTGTTESEQEEHSVLLTVAQFAYLFLPAYAASSELKKRKPAFPISSATYPLALIDVKKGQENAYGF